MGIEIILNHENFDKAISQFPGKLLVEMRKSFRQVGEDFIAKIQKTLVRGHLRITGDLARSFGRVVFGENLEALTLSIYSGSKYARIHEKGGTITAKPGKALAIPLDAAKTAGGASRYKSPKEIPDLVMIKRPGRPPLLVKQAVRGRGMDRRIMGIPMFVLVKSVMIKPQLGMFDLWEKEASNTATIINDGIGECIKRF